MAKTYTKCADEVHRKITALINQHHKELRHVAARVEALNVTTDREGEPALTLRGYPCYAVVRVTTVRERTAGRGDAEIIIDREAYLKMTEAQREALLDHELYHLEPALDRHDDFKFDTAGRPVLRLRLHDFEVGWFHAIAQRHGEASVEVLQARRLLHRHGQLYFNFTDNAHELAKAAAPIPNGSPAAALADLARPDGIESVTITHEATGEGVKVDATGVHPLKPKRAKKAAA